MWTDERITVEETLKATGEAMLKKLENPAVTYEIDVQTIHEAANLVIGDMVRVVYDRLDEYMVVQELSKDNVGWDLYNGKIILGSGTNDLGNSIAEIAENRGFLRHIVKDQNQYSWIVFMIMQTTLTVRNIVYNS